VATRKLGETKPAFEIGALSQFVGYWLRRAQVAFFEDFMRDAPSPKLTPGQLALLELISKNPNLSQNRLSEGLRVDKSTLALTLHRLSRRGLIRRIRSTEDRRQNGLRLTAEGRSVLRSMLRYIPRHERRMTSKLSASERRTVVTLLRKIVEERG
jgi:DNA-binding MarR family transcriptional regulator